ncbi:PP2C family protein-serine/threonine phosphatase [Streptomyces sp. V1I1]|uniref:PP2C family protein-serine/threonine phosphatase n=1 Tax=Streptomyces sp. V1I1 TaxID=3042272 RepID=UPI00277F8FCA|nr:PP2C family protein-serine/threonine phosphatase [Streptomyces sp. V1I1]MDQ0942756.1 serine phosphatase RsbU (regulator of sigma subunit) [Streptomyces sp. V1I1]
MGLRRRLADLWQPWQSGHALLAIPLALIVAITVVDVLAPRHIHLGPLLVVAPAITPSFAGPRLTALVGALAVIAQTVIAALRGGFTANHQVQIAALAVISLLLVYFCRKRERRIRVLDRVRSVSEATQRVVLRPLPHRMGPLRIASSYLAAEDEAQIGGDLYAATRAGNGTRLIIGDVRGKGLTSISDASVLMGAFREAAHRSTTLLELGDTLENSICRHLAEQAEHTHHSEADHELHEHFITALILDIPDEDPMVQMTNCGHPPPLLLHKGRVTTLYSSHPQPPLGMCDLPRTGFTLNAFTFEDDDTLLLYTDGVIEARAPDGTFYPLAERVAQWTGSGPEKLLQHIRDDLLAFVGGHLGDDAAMVVIQRSPKLQPGHQLRKIIHISGISHHADGAPDAEATPHSAPGQE